MQRFENLSSPLTVAGLSGAGPNELVRLAFLSPLRALATCIFGIGLPSNLFSQLQRQPQSSGGEKFAFPVSVNRGVLLFAFPISAPRRRRTAALRIVLDLVIVAIAGVMLWRNWRVGTMVMVTWRCEYRWLLFFWPVACVAWWVMTVGSLWLMARKIEIYRHSDRARVPWRALLTMGYFVPSDENSVSGPRGLVQPAEGKSDDRARFHATHMPSALPDADFNGDSEHSDSVMVRVEFPSEAHWRWWDAAVQAVAVGIYLYATFCLSSMLFLSGNEAILYAVGMTLSLTAIRILTALV